jgi:hypothetical protein
LNLLIGYFDLFLDILIININLLEDFKMQQVIIKDQISVHLSDHYPTKLHVNKDGKNGRVSFLCEYMPETDEEYYPNNYLARSAWNALMALEKNKEWKVNLDGSDYWWCKDAYVSDEPVSKEMTLEQLYEYRCSYAYYPIVLIPKVLNK